MGITREQYEAAIPKCCAYQTMEAHESIMLCWGLALAVEEGRNMNCDNCTENTAQVGSGETATKRLREHNDNRLWRALTYDSGPYDVTTPTLALCHLARVFFAAGVAAALAGCVDMVQPPDIAVAEELCAKRGGYSHAQRWERGTVLDVNCKDGTQPQVRLPKTA